MTTVTDSLNQHAQYKRATNELIRESLQDRDRADMIGFFCECGDPACFEAVWLSLDDYQAERAGPEGTVLTAGHRPSRRVTPS